MAQLPDSLLAWLWEKSQIYAQARLVYNDVAATLSQYPSLRPRTATYTYETGHEDLLLCLFGTIPADFRGAQYRYPVEVWIPKTYGMRGAGIICLIRPDGGKDGQDSGMAVRPGQHVAVDGRVYHPYLRDWGFNERASITEFISILQGVFAREPPIVAQRMAATSPAGQSQLPSIPPKTPHRVNGSPATSARPSNSGPPPLPLKPGQSSPSPAPPSNGYTQPDTGPPLPPLPHELKQRQSASPPYANGAPRSSPHQGQDPRHRQYPPPPLPQISSKLLYQQPQDTRSPVSPLTPVEARFDHYSQALPPPQPQGGQPPPAHIVHQMPQGIYSGPGRGQQVQAIPPQQASPPVLHLQPQQQPTSTPSHLRAAQPQPKAQVPDLLTDPFDISLDVPTKTGPAPPIPPNPEKEHLLQLLSQSFAAQAQAKIQQARSAVAPLTAQRQALLEAQSRLQAELRTLQGLDGALASNERILRQSTRDCDAAAESGRAMAHPNTDELLVAPSVAAQQLWNLCADEAAIREALWCLQLAVGAGRVSGAEFIRLTRGLAREAFLKKALMRKVAIGLGLGLEVHSRDGRWAGFG